MEIFITQMELVWFFTKLDIVHIEDVDILIRYNIRISPVMDNVHIMVDKRCTDTGGGYQGYYYDTLMEVVQTWTEKYFPNEWMNDMCCFSANQSPLRRKTKTGWSDNVSD